MASYEASQGVTCPSTPPASPPTGTPGYTNTIYNAAGQETSTTNPIGGTTQYAYDASGNKYCTVIPLNYANGTRCPSLPITTPTVSSDSYLGATIDTFNAQSQISQETNPLGGITLDTYDNSGNKLSQTVESNNATTDPTVVTDYTYDGDNNVTSTTVDPGGGSLAGTTKSYYDPDGHTYCTVSAKAYAEDGSSFQCPAWQSAWIAASPSPAALYSSTPSSTQANDVTMSFYDPNGNLVQQTNPDVSTTATAYDPDGHAYCVLSALDLSTWLTAHSGSSYPYQCPTSPPTTAPTTGSNPNYETKIYDAAANLLSDTDGNGDTTSYAYDPASKQTTTTSPTGGVTTNCYYWQTSTCASGAPTAGGTGSSLYSTTTPATQQDSSGAVTTYTYFPGGTTDVTTTQSGTTTDGYDANGDLASTSYSNTASGYATPANVSYTYYPDGSQHTMTDGTGETTTNENANGETTSSSFTASGGLTSTTTSYTYFTTGARASLTYPPLGSVPTPEVTYTYDATGAIATESDWQGNITHFSHDADNNATSTVDPNGTTVSDTYDLGDVETNVAATQTSGGSTLVNYATPRNADEQLSSETDTVNGTTGSPTTYGYNDADQLSNVKSSTPNATYDASGNPTGLTNGAAQNFDAAGELCWTAATAPSPAPADPDSRCSATPPSGATTYGYNSQGDRTSTTTGTSTSSYLYNQTGELINETPGGTSSYTTVTPTRVCDTRSGNPSGLSGFADQCNNSAMSAGSTLSLQLGSGGSTGTPVPSTATAVVVNLTAEDSGTATHYLTVYPYGSTRPGTSTLDVPAGGIANNQVTVGVGSDSGAPGITIYNLLDTVNVQVDVVGYYTSGSSGSGYVPVSPTRICDSRSGTRQGCPAPTTSATGVPVIPVRQSAQAER